MSNSSGEQKWVYLLGEGRADMRNILGGKGANLSEMHKLGIPVPPSFTVSSGACLAYLQGGNEFPSGLWEQVLIALGSLEKETGKRFGDPSSPLLVSCRSGAAVSMPGMMDTVLNIGLNDEVAHALAKKIGNPKFVYDSYRRLIQMFGSVVMNVPDEPFEDALALKRDMRGVESDSDLKEEDLLELTGIFRDLVKRYAGRPLPEDPQEQLRLAIEAVFRSWNGRRAIDYRRATGIPNTLGTAVNIVTMVFGNLDEQSGTGVAMSRNPTTGERELDGDYLMRAQGEDVVAGTRNTTPIPNLKNEMPEIYEQLSSISSALELHYRNAQDMEFTIESGKLWLLQTRDAKRTALAEVCIAVDMVREGLISKEEAICRVTPDQIDCFLHPQLDPDECAHLQPLASGLNVAPGAAVGLLCLDSDSAEKWAAEGKSVVLVRAETKPEDVHGILAAKGVLTTRGGRTSHAALVARQFGKPAVVGAHPLEINMRAREISSGEITIKEGDWISLDGTKGLVFAGQLSTITPDISNASLQTLLSWADEIRRLGVWANADYARDALRAREYGAQGIGLCRTEHMFFETDRLPVVRRMIMASTETERALALEELLPLQRGDFESLFRVMDGLPVIIRLLDPPLHEFLPCLEDLLEDIADLKIRIQHAASIQEMNKLLDSIHTQEKLLSRVKELKEANPMLGLRGVRLGIMVPELVATQVRAIFEAACLCLKDGIKVMPKVMIPLVAHINELKRVQETVERVAREVLNTYCVSLDYKFGTMIELPRAAITAAELADVAEFFSFGTNDLTQTTYGISRDDAEASFLMDYLSNGILTKNPFATLDEHGVGQLIAMAVKNGRSTRPNLEVGVCGEHGGDPDSIALCERFGLDYVSCSPYRVPIARLAAAQARIQAREQES